MLLPKKCVSTSLPIEAFIHQCGFWTCITYFALNPNTIYLFLLKLLQLLALGTLSVDSCVPLTYPHNFLCAYLFTYLFERGHFLFWQYEMFPSHLVYFLPWF